MSEREPGGRARDLGIRLPGRTGPGNTITDVPGVEVGYATLIEGSDVRTGVTAVLPLGKDGLGQSCPAGWYALNGNGEMTGTAWLSETGALALPIAITNTHAIGPVHRGVIEWSVEQAPGLGQRWLLPVVAETWDGYLNDPNSASITPGVAKRALDAATGTAPADGSFGGGTGMILYGYKGGTGGASRVVEIAARQYTVGVLTQANFGDRRELTINGHRIGEQLQHEPDPQQARGETPPGSGSCIVIVATDAPLLPGQCAALARRVPLGLARTGASGSHYSGDLFLAFSATNPGALDSDRYASELSRIEFVPWGVINPLYEAVIEAVEEAVLNVLAASRPMVGRAEHYCPGFPVERMPALLDTNR
jgi:D-aminopeptidase